MKIRCRSIMASESDGNYDISFKKNGTTYYIELLSDGGNYVAKWWDSSDNGLGYNNKGWVAIEGKNYRALNNIEDVNSDNVVDLLSVISDYDRKPGKPIQDRIKREVAKLVDFGSINSGCTKKSVKGGKNIKRKPRNVQVYFWHNNAYNAVVMTDGEYWITFDDSFDGIDLYDEDVITELKSYIKTTDFNDFDDMYNQFANDENGNSPVVGDNFGGEFDTSELTKVGTIYEGKANSACGKKSIKSNKRRAIKASDFEFIMDEPEVDEEDDSLAGYYSWDELTDAQREYVVSHWGDFRSFADAMYGWFNDYIMDMYYEDKEMLADEYNEKYGFNIDTDNISWSSSSQGPYPDHWDNEKIFGKVWLATAGNLSDVDVSFGGIYDVDTYADYYVGVGDDEHIEYGVGVDELADYGADEEAISIIRNLADGAQEFVDKVWELINYTCTAYPDDEWISETLDGNPNSFTFIVDDNGDVEDIN